MATLENSPQYQIESSSTGQVSPSDNTDQQGWRAASWWASFSLIILLVFFWALTRPAQVMAPPVQAPEVEASAPSLDSPEVEASAPSLDSSVLDVSASNPPAGKSGMTLYTPASQGSSAPAFTTMKPLIAQGPAFPTVGTVGDVSDISKLKAGPGAPVSAIPFTIQASDSADPLFESVLGMVQFRRGEILSTAGWLRLLTQHGDASTGGSPNAGVGRGERTQETWFQLDSDGRIQAIVARPLTSVEQGTPSGDWRLLTPETSGEQAFYSPDLGFMSEAIRLTSLGNKLNRQSVWHDCWYQGELFTIAEDDLRHDALINPVTGKLRSLMTYRLLSGKLELIEGVELVLEERFDQPPAEVLALVTGSSSP